MRKQNPRTKAQTANFIAAERAELAKRTRIANDARAAAKRDFQDAPKHARVMWAQLGRRLPSDTSALTERGLQAICQTYALASWEAEGVLFCAVYDHAYIQQWNDLVE